MLRLVLSVRDRSAAAGRRGITAQLALDVYLRLTAQLLGLVTPVAMLLIVDKVVTQGARNTLIALTGGVALLTLFQYLFLIGQALHASREAEVLALPARRRLLRSLLDSAAAPRWASAGWDAMLGCQDEGRFHSESRPQALADVVFVVLLALLMAAFSPLLLLVSLAFTPLYVLVERLGGRLGGRHGTAAAALRDQLALRYFESVRAAELVRGLNLTSRLASEWDELDTRLAGFRYRLALWRRLTMLGVEALQKVSLILIMLLGVGLVIAGQLTLGQYIAFNLLSMQLAQPVLRLAGYRRARDDQRLQQASRERLELECRAVRWPAGGALLAPAGETVLEVDGLISANGRRLSFMLRPGLWLGITGPSGCGKTTALRTLAGLGDAQSGSIRLNGVPLAQLDPAERSRLIRLVPQDPVLFSASIADNIRLGDPAALPEAIFAAAVVCGLGPLLATLPEHLDTPVGAAGRPLSGGERQRIAIARSLVGDPRVLLLDEATAALDAAAEAQLLAELRRYRPDSAVVLVSHRASTLEFCDALLRIDDSAGPSRISALRGVA